MDCRLHFFKTEQYLFWLFSSVRNSPDQDEIKAELSTGPNHLWKSQTHYYYYISRNFFAYNQHEKLEAAKAAYLYLWLTFVTFPYLWLPFVTFTYLSLPLLTFPNLQNLSLTFFTLFTFPYISLAILSYSYLCLPLPFLTLPYLFFPFLTFSYLSLPFLLTFSYLSLRLKLGLLSQSKSSVAVWY